MKASTHTILFALTLVGACILPPLFVDNASYDSRVMWFEFLTPILIVGLIGGVAASKNKTPEMVAYEHNMSYLPLIVMMLLASSVVALSVKFANLTAATGNTAFFARLLPSLVEPVFPWIGKYRAARVGWGISELQVLKSESIMALWFIFGCVLTVLLVSRWILLTPDQRNLESQVNEQVTRNRLEFSSGTSIFFAVAFGFLMATSEYFGWGNFDGGLTPCLLSTRCYVEYDLMIIVAAGAKCFVVFGFSSGSVLMAKKFFAHRL